MPPSETTHIARVDFRNDRRVFGIKAEDRFSHIYIIGKTGTGKSTSAALILHRICELAPEGHIVMIDPHGEYMQAFRHTGQLLDVSNLNMP